MRKIVLVFLFCFSARLPAQKLYAYPADVVAPRGAYQTCTAVVNGVNNKTVSWSATGGSLIGTNPGTANEPNVIALYTTAPGVYTVTATSNANGSVTGTCTVHITASPVPLTGHPRFLFTGANLPAMQAKATRGNVAYQAIRSQATTYYSQLSSAPLSWSWTCKAGTGRPAVVTQYLQYQAYFFAAMALLDPADKTYNWKCYAHDVGIYFMTLDTTDAGEPGANAFSDQSVNAALVSDWLLGSGAVTSPSDIAEIHTYLGWLAQRVLTWTGSTTLGASHTAPIPMSAYNTSAVFNAGSPFDLGAMRSNSGNNYNESRLLILAAIGYTFNDNTTDDPALPNTCSATRYQVCPDFSAGSLHAYARYFDGVLLYNYWAHIEDPTVSWQAYQAAYSNLPAEPVCKNTDLHDHPCFGDGRGGESSEGSWYSYSMYRARYAFNILHTAGLDDPTVLGPQISASTSSWWDMKYISDLEFITGNTVQGTYTYPNYNYLTTGDSYKYVKEVSDAWTEAAMLAFDSYTGRTDRSSALKWLNYNFAPGGPSGKSWGCAGTWCGYDAVLPNYNFSDGSAVDMFIALPAGDPMASLPPDPRPSLPLDLYNGSFNQHGLVRSSWTNPTLFSYYFPNSMINHEYQIDGALDIYANQEYITKHRTIFNNYNIYMVSADQIGVLNVHNSTGATCTAPNCTNWQLFNSGGQVGQGTQAGLIPVLHSELPEYVAVTGTTTNAYNGAAYGNFSYSTYHDVAAASRDIMYLRGTNQVVLYDRVTVGHSTSTQALTEITTGVPAISGSTASWLTRSGNQKSYFTSLLPSGATVAKTPIVSLTKTSASHSSLQKGTTMQMACTNTYADGTSGDCTSVAAWSTGNPAIATISPTGLITTVGLGETQIVAIVKGIGGSGTLTVIPGESSGSWSNTSDTTQLADWEPASSVTVTPSGTPTSSRFLSVLEWGPSSLTRNTTTLIQSTAGQNFDCVKISASMVCFMRSWPAAFTSMTYPASGATTHHIYDLTPNTTYSISGAGAPNSATTDTAGVLTFTSNGTENIVIRANAKVGATAKIGTSSDFEIPALCAAAALTTSLILSSCMERFGS